MADTAIVCSQGSYSAYSFYAVYLGDEDEIAALAREFDRLFPYPDWKDFPERDKGGYGNRAYDLAAQEWERRVGGKRGDAFLAWLKREHPDAIREAPYHELHDDWGLITYGDRDND